MSTTIYNGYKFPDGTTLEQVFSQFGPCGSIMRQMADEKARTNIMIRANEAIDNAMAHCLGIGAKESYDDLDDGQSPFGEAFSNVMELGREKNSTEANFLSGEAAVVVIPHPSGLYALTYFRDQAMDREFQKQMQLTPHPYWNNADEPEGMDYEAWEERGRLWEELLGEDQVPSHAGATFQMVGKGDFMPWMSGFDVLEDQSPIGLERRVWRLAVDAPQTGLQNAGGTGNCHRMLMTLKDNPPTEFIELCDTIRKALPEPIPAAWFRMKRKELLAACQERVLQTSTPKAVAGKPGPRI